MKRMDEAYKARLEDSSLDDILCEQGQHRYDKGSMGLSHNDPVTVYKCENCGYFYWV